MNKLFLATILFAAIAASVAWPIKPDDKKYWEDQVDVIAKKDLETWTTAVQANDKKTLVRLLGDVEKAVADAQSNNGKFLPFIGKAVSSLNGLANGSKWTFWLRMKSLQLLVNAVDGNRDNKSYYLLDAAREWVERRSASTSGQLKEDLVEIQKRAVAARDTLEGMAQVFVKGIKDLKELTKEAAKNEPQIQAVVKGMVEKSKDAEALKDRYQEAVDKIRAVIAATKTNTRVNP